MNESTLIKSGDTTRAHRPASSPANMASFLWICLWAVMAQLLWAVLLFVAPSPLYALAGAIAVTVGLAILVAPQLGVGLLTFLLIGQWPGNIITYLGLLTVVAAIAWLVIHRQSLVPRNFILWLTFCFLALGAISLVAPKTSINSTAHLVSLAGRCSIVWLYVTLVSSRRFLILNLYALVASGVATALIGLVQWRTHFMWITSTTHGVLSKADFRHKTVMDLQGWSGQFRIDSITGTPDYLPLYMQSLAPFVAFWILRQSSRSKRLLGLLVLSLFAAAHVLSFTRGALLTTAAVVAIGAWMSDKKRFIIYGPVLATCGLLVMFSWTPTRERLVSMIELNRDEHVDHVNTGAWRLSVVPVVIGMVSERPLTGYGLGQQRWNWPEEVLGVLIPDPEVIDPLPVHNDYLLVSAELGLGGLTLLVLLLLSSIIQLGRLSNYFQNQSDYEMRDMARATQLAMIGIALAMLFYPMVDSFRYFWLMLGVTAAMQRISMQSRSAQ